MKRTAVALVAAGALIVAGCSGDDDDDEVTESNSGTTVVETGTQGQAELVADATSVAVAYFQARSVHDFEEADERSTGAAELVIDWDEAVSEIPDLEGTPYEIDPVEAPSVRVEISAIDETGDGRLEAEGFVELGQRPDGVATTTTTAPPEGLEPDDSTYVTDMVFVRDGDELHLEDYRFDDIEYPVSELYLDSPDDDEATDATTDGTAPDEAADADDADVEIEYGHRDLDGSVQWILDHDDDDVVLEARFFEGDEAPEPGAEGVPVDVFPTADDDATTTTVDDDDGDVEDGRTLLVQAGAFPGLPGTMRLTVQSDDGSGEPLVVDVDLPEFPELGAPQPTNVIRDAQRDVEDTTTTTQPEDESTTTTEPEDEVTTTTGAEDVTTTTAPTTSTTMATTTSSTDEE
jgi:hypothetical protein